MMKAEFRVFRNPTTGWNVLRIHRNGEFIASIIPNPMRLSKFPFDKQHPEASKNFRKRFEVMTKDNDDIIRADRLELKKLLKNNYGIVVPEKHLRRIKLETSFAPWNMHTIKKNPKNKSEQRLNYAIQGMKYHALQMRR